MDSSELLQTAAEAFESLGIEYFVTGSMATITYGEPRFTNDVDIVARIDPDRVEDVCQLFPAPEYYCSREAMLQAISSKSMFNIIHPTSGLKLDIIIPEPEPFNESRFDRRRSLSVGSEKNVWFASPEDVILKKLSYYREGGSEKHIRDIRGVLKLQTASIDFDYLKLWARKLELSDYLESVLDREL